MSQESKWHENVKRDLENLVAKSSAANAKILKDGAAFLKQVAEKKVDLSNVKSTGSALLTDTLNSFVSLQIEHASRLIDLGVAVSENIFSTPAQDAGKDTASGPGVSATGTGVQFTSDRPSFELQLSGSPGDLCQTAFILQSGQNQSVNARFCFTNFVNVESSAQVSIPIRFEPSEIDLAQTDKIRIVLEVPVPASIAYGIYSALIWIDSCPQMNFKVFLSINTAPEKAKKRTSAVKKRALAKDIKKSTRVKKRKK